MAHNAVRRRLDYELAIRPMTDADIAQAHQLSVGVSWPHRPEDWRFALEVGHGFVACDAIDRALASAMWWPFGARFATVGMVITSPRLQMQGAGRRLMDTILEAAGDRDLRLNATRAGYRLYRSLDFRPVGRIVQHQGRAHAPPRPDSGQFTVRVATEADAEAIARLDADAYGADRSRVIAALTAPATGTVLERDGAVAGFALCRRFGRGHVVGPVVAESEEAAIALVGPHVRAHEGRFLRLDTACGQGPFGGFLEDCGLTVFDTVTTMIRGRDHGPGGKARTFGLVNQAVG